MNKKNISIETNFFGQQNASILNQQQYRKSQHTSKSESSAVNQLQQQLEENINNYRYEQVYGRQFNDEVSIDRDEDSYVQGCQGAQKLHAAYQLQNTLSRMTADLFISCWESLKELLDDQGLLYKRIQNDIRKEDNTKEQYMTGDVNESLKKVQGKVISAAKEFPNVIESSLQRKRQILQRQQRGLTLNSLQKMRNRSKSLNQQQPQHNAIPNSQSKPVTRNPINKKTIQIHQQTIMRPIKSYRQKFEEHKQRNNIKQPKTSSKQVHMSNKLPYSEFSYHNYFLNHPDNSKNFSNQKISYNNPTIPAHNIGRQNYQFQFQKNKANIQLLEVNQNHLLEQDLIRARLLQEITEKLNFSKFRMQGRQPGRQRDLQLVQKIARLQKTVLSLKRQNKERRENNITTLPSSDSRKINEFLSPNDKHDELLLRRFMTEISNIRSQISQIKIKLQSSLSAKKYNQPSQKFNSYHTLVNYQHGLGQTNRVQRNQNPPYTSVKIGPNLQNTQTSIKIIGSDSKPNSAQTSKVYKKILKDERNQNYQQEQRQIRQQQVRQMVENVKRKRQQTSVIRSQSNLIGGRPIRQKYEQDYQRRQKEGEDLSDDEEDCCFLVNY